MDPYVPVRDGPLWLNMSAEFLHGHPVRPRVPPVEQATTMVLVAAYREYRCGRTLWDLFRKARYPENVLVGVVDQRLDEDMPCLDQFCDLWVNNRTGRNPDAVYPPESADSLACPFRNNVRIIDVDARKSKGPCYARGRGAELLPDELPTFCLQTDSHMLFVYDWDIELQDEWRQTENEFAVLTTYAANYYDLDPSGRSKKRRDVPHICQTIWGGHQFPRNQQASAAINLPRAKLTNLWGAGLSYARCHFERAVPYDPGLVHIFDGEEYGRMARLWTHGYDTYTPSKNYVFHDYTHVKHFWSGEVSQAGVNVAEEEKAAVPRLETLFGMVPNDSPRHVDIEPYSLGNCRTYDQLVRFTGVETRHDRQRKTTTGEKCGQLSWVPYDPACHDPRLVESGTGKKLVPFNRIVEAHAKAKEHGSRDAAEVAGEPGPDRAGADQSNSMALFEELDRFAAEVHALDNDPSAPALLSEQDEQAGALSRRLHARLVLVLDGIIILLAAWAVVSCRGRGRSALKKLSKTRRGGGASQSSANALEAGDGVSPSRGALKRTRKQKT